MTIELFSPSPNQSLGLAFFDPVVGVKRCVAEQRAIDHLLCRLLQMETPPRREHYPDGAPYLPAYPKLSISISHCIGCVAVLITPKEQAPGVDVEQYREQLCRVESRYINTEEWQRLLSYSTYTEEELRTLLWTAKEASYKIAHPTSGSLLSYQVEDIDPSAQKLYLVSQEQGRSLTLSYLFRPPYTISFGSQSRG